MLVKKGSRKDKILNAASGLGGETTSSVLFLSLPIMPALIAFTSLVVVVPVGTSGYINAKKKVF